MLPLILFYDIKWVYGNMGCFDSINPAFKIDNSVSLFVWITTTRIFPVHSFNYRESSLHVASWKAAK